MQLPRVDMNTLLGIYCGEGGEGCGEGEGRDVERGRGGMWRGGGEACGEGEGRHVERRRGGMWEGEGEGRDVGR